MQLPFGYLAGAPDTNTRHIRINSPSRVFVFRRKVKTKCLTEATMQLAAQGFQTSEILDGIAAVGRTSPRTWKYLLCRISDPNLGCFPELLQFNSHILPRIVSRQFMRAFYCGWRFWRPRPHLFKSKKRCSAASLFKDAFALESIDCAEIQQATLIRKSLSKCEQTCRRLKC